MRISDWSSDVCSSDLTTDANNYQARVDDARNQLNTAISQLKSIASANGYNQQQLTEIQSQQANTVDTLKIRIGKIHDRKSDVEGKSVSVRVALGGHRSSKKTNTAEQTKTYVYI